MIYKTIKGQQVPGLGLGTFGLTGSDGMRSIGIALDLGYRMLDTAQRYANEAEIGEAIAASSIDRADIFVTTKIWPTDLDPAGIARLADESLGRLKSDYVDLLLVHWPNPAFPLADVLEAFLAIKSAGKARQIGVSNFPMALLDEALRLTGDDLFCNQVEYHPYLNQQPMIDKLRAHDMLLTAYMPLAKGSTGSDPLLREIGEQYGKSPEQVVLRWLTQQDNVIAIPRSSREVNLRANADIFDFALSDDQMASISAMRAGRRLASPAWGPEWDPA